MTRGEPSNLLVQIHLDDEDAPDDADRLHVAEVVHLARAVLRDEAVTAAEVAIIFCGDRRSAELNRKWFDHDEPTDVIAFPLSRHPASPLEGEVYVNLAQARRQAPASSVSVDEEVRRLVVHGLLHLAGWEDREEEAAAVMRRRQEIYVQAWPNPLLRLERTP